MSTNEPKPDEPPAEKPQPGTDGAKPPSRSPFGWISEYKEIIGIGIAVAGAVFSGAAWVISYFATQTAVSQLECRLTHQMNAASYDSKAEVIQSHINEKQSQIQSMALQKQTQSTQAAVTKLAAEVKELQKAAKEESKNSDDQLTLAVKCATAK
ncbi:MAG TPA: hypothetical protein VMT72_10430 [Pseudolabrys sp.]|nr:hypothetical protein [Pseudolabrys sp.]